MLRRRPGGAVFFGVSNIIVGAMGLLFYVCSGLFVVGVATGPGDTAWSYVHSQLPSFAPMAAAHIIVSLVLCVLLLLSGIGLLNVQNWGRLVAIACAILVLLLNVWNSLYQIAWVNPVMQQRPLTPRVGDPMAGPRAVADRASHAVEVAMMNVVVLGAAVLAMIYGTALLITMLLPNTAAAFNGGPGRYWDEYDDRPRRPRRNDDEWDD